jgi:hypothetical protein
MNIPDGGLYLELFHGRQAGEQLDDWGVQGPIFGPFPYFHTTYACEIKFNEAHVLSITDEMVRYDGLYYGDWSVFASLDQVNDKTRLQPFDQAKADKTDR